MALRTSSTRIVSVAPDIVPTDVRAKWKDTEIALGSARRRRREVMERSRKADEVRSYVRPPWCDTSVSPVDKRRYKAQHIAEISQWCTFYDAAIAAPMP